jgi:uncharacterized protein YdeI (YjbR/CyaY-like superfamily)
VTVFFESPDEWRAWLEEHHDSSREIIVGFWKRGSGRPSITWPESVDEALCFGWIDGVRRSLDEDGYTIRFTPRRSRSTWSAVNVRRAQELIRLGRMAPSGLKAFEARADDRTATYSYEQRRADLDGVYAERLRSNPRAWEFFQSRPPSYRKAAAWWVTSAKQEETRLRRLATLIDDSAHGRTIAPLTRKPRR